MQVQHQLNLHGRIKLHLERPKDTPPGRFVPAQQFFEVAPGTCQGSGSGRSCRRGCPVPGRRDRNDPVHCDGVFLRGPDLEAPEVETRPAFGHSGGPGDVNCRRNGHAHLALGGLHLRGQDRAGVAGWRYGPVDQMDLGTQRGLGKVAVADQAIDPGGDIQKPAPVAGCEPCPDSQDVPGVHGHEPRFFQVEMPPVRRFQQEMPGQDRLFHIEDAAFMEDLQAAPGPPWGAFQAQVQGQAVGQVDHVLFRDGSFAYRGPNPVIYTGQIRSGIAAGPAVFTDGSPYPHVSVAEGGQGFAVALMLRIHAFVDQQPRIPHHEAQVQFGEVVDHHVGTGSFQVRPVAVPVNAHHQAESAPACGQHPGDGVFHHHGAPHAHVQPAGGLQECIGGRFAGQTMRRCHPAIDDHRERVQQVGGGKDGDRVAAGGYQRGGDTGVLQVLQEPAGARKDLHASFLQPSQVGLVLPGPKPDGGPVAAGVLRGSRRDVHSPGCPEPDQPLFPGPAVHQGVVVIRCEGGPASILRVAGIINDGFVHLFPRREVNEGRICHHSIQVKNDCVVRSCSRCCGGRLFH